MSPSSTPAPAIFTAGTGALALCFSLLLCRPFKGPAASYLFLYLSAVTSLFFSDTSKPRPQRRLNVTLPGRKRKGELRHLPELVVRCAERRRRKLSRGLRRRASPGRWSVPAGSGGRTGRGSSRRVPDRQGRTPRYLLPRAWSQYYRSGDVEGAEESPSQTHHGTPAVSERAGTPPRARSSATPRTGAPTSKEIAAAVIVPPTAHAARC